MALIALGADKGSPGVTTTALALAAIWPRGVLVAECDTAGGDLVYRLPADGGERLNPARGLLSLAATARRGLRAEQVWEHTQQLAGGLPVLPGLTSSEQATGLGGLWRHFGRAFATLPHTDVLADCGRIGPDGPQYDMFAEADIVLLLTRATLEEVVRLRDRLPAIEAGLRRRGRATTPVGVVVVTDAKRHRKAVAEVARILNEAETSAAVLGGIADDPRGAALLRGEWGARLDRTVLIGSARQIAGEILGRLAGGRPSLGSQPVPPAPPTTHHVPTATQPPTTPPTPTPAPPNRVTPSARTPASPAPAAPSAGTVASPAPAAPSASTPGPVTASASGPDRRSPQSAPRDQTPSPYTPGPTPQHGSPQTPQAQPVPGGPGATAPPEGALSPPAGTPQPSAPTPQRPARHAAGPAPYPAPLPTDSGDGGGGPAPHPAPHLTESGDGGGGPAPHPAPRPTESGDGGDREGSRGDGAEASQAGATPAADPRPGTDAQPSPSATEDGPSPAPVDDPPSPPSGGAASSGAPSSGAPSGGAPSSGAPSGGAASSGAPSGGAASSGPPYSVDPPRRGGEGQGNGLDPGAAVSQPVRVASIVPPPPKRPPKRKG